MPLNLDSTDFLSRTSISLAFLCVVLTRQPDIDTELTPSQRESIISQIKAEQPQDQSQSLHPSIPDVHEPAFSDLITAELERIEQKAPLKAIDLSRYESSALSAPTSTTNSEETLAQWRQTLQRAYGLKTYLDGRYTNLSLLETYGKNAWLIGNSQLEDEVKALQRELEVVKGEGENVEEQRRRQQEGVKAEMDALEVSWRNGVRGVVEVELATEGLRREVLGRKRVGAGG